MTHAMLKLTSSYPPAPVHSSKLISFTDNNSLNDVVNLQNFSEEEYINIINGCSLFWGLVQTASTEAVYHEAKPQWRLFRKKKEEVLLVLHNNHNNTNPELVVSLQGKEIDKWTSLVKTC